MASLMVISSASVADPCPDLRAVPFTKAFPLPSRMICISQTPRIGFRETGLRLRRRSSSSVAAANASRTYKQCLPVCLFGGKGKSEGDSEASPWKALEKAIGNFKGSSVEDVLRKQIEKKDYFDDGGSGENPPRGRGGGGGGGDFGGSEDEGLSGFMEEALQVFLATAAFILLYIYLLEGEEMVKLINDFIKFLFGGQPSLRLQRVLSDWQLFFSTFSKKEEEEMQKDWLERAIADTPTWWDSPEKYRRLRRKILGRSRRPSSSSSYVASSPYE